MRNIFRDLKRDKIIEVYTDKDRYIEPRIYYKLKKVKRCMYCKKKFSGQIPEIHHILPKSKGGTDEENNLMAVHKKCHHILDKKEGV